MPPVTFTEVRRHPRGSKTTKVSQYNSKHSHWVAVNAQGVAIAAACGPTRIRTPHRLTEPVPAGEEPNCPVCGPKYQRVQVRKLSTKYKWPRWEIREGLHPRAGEGAVSGQVRAHLVALDAQGQPVGPWCRSLKPMSLAPEPLPWGPPRCRQCLPGWRHLQRQQAAQAAALQELVDDAQEQGIYGD